MRDASEISQVICPCCHKPAPRLLACRACGKGRCWQCIDDLTGDCHSCVGKAGRDAAVVDTARHAVSSPSASRGSQLSLYDRTHIEEMLADKNGKHFNWFSCQLLRLIARADKKNRAKLAVAFPEHVEAYEEWYNKP